MFPRLPPDRVELHDTWQTQRQGQQCGDILNLLVDSHLAWDGISASEDLPAFQGQTITCWGPVRGALLFSPGAKGRLRLWFLCFHSVTIWPQRHKPAPEVKTRILRVACYSAQPRSWSLKTVSSWQCFSQCSERLSLKVSSSSLLIENVGKIRSRAVCGTPRSCRSLAHTLGLVIFLLSPFSLLLNYTWCALKSEF